MKKIRKIFYIFESRKIIFVLYLIQIYQDVAMSFIIINDQYNIISIMCEIMFYLFF